MRDELRRRLSEAQQIEYLVDNYRDTREKYLENLKKIATFGVTRGAVKYLECLLEVVQVGEVVDEMMMGDDSAFN